MYYLVKITAAVLFSLLLFVLSALLHRHVPVMTTAAVVTAVPAVLIKFGLPGFTWVDFVSLSRASPMLLNLPGTAFYAVAFAVVCAVLAVKSGVKWEDKPKKSTFLRGRKSAKN